MEIIVKLFPFIKFLTICYLIYKLGFIYGYGLFFIVEYLYIHKIMKHFFNYYPLSYGDKTFTFLQKSEKYNIVCLLKFDKIKREEIKQLIIEIFWEPSCMSTIITKDSIYSAQRASWNCTIWLVKSIVWLNIKCHQDKERYFLFTGPVSSNYQRIN